MINDRTIYPATVILLMRRLFQRNSRDEDFSAFLDDAKKSTKQILIEKCRRNNASIYVDDASETSSGIYAQLRGVASEAELERRLNAKKALGLASRANTVAILAFLVSIATLVVAIKPMWGNAIG